MHVRQYIETLKAIALDSEGCANQRLAAMIVYKGKVISVGTNQNKTHPFQAEFGRNGDAIFWHAETNAIHKALTRIDEDDLKKATLIVCRVKNERQVLRVKDGNRTRKKIVDDLTFGAAKPCVGCQNCIDHYDIRRVIYTEDSDIGKLNYMVCER